MDEDIKFTMNILVSTTGGTLRYWQVPYRCTFRDLVVIAANSDIGDSKTVTVDNVTQSVELGVATFGTDIAAGAKAVWAADSTYGDTVCADGDVLTFTATSTANTDIIELIIELDPKCRAA